MTEKKLWILAATLQLIDERGLQSTPMTAIAKRASVAMGTIYHHFPNKEMLVSELYQELTKKLGNHVLAHYDAQAPVRARLAQIVTSYIFYNLQNRREFLFRDQYAYSPYIKPAAKVDQSGWIQAMSQMMMDGQAQEILKPVDIEVLLQAILGIIDALVKKHFAGGVELDEDGIETAVNLCWDAIKR